MAERDERKYLCKNCQKRRYTEKVDSYKSIDEELFGGR